MLSSDPKSECVIQVEAEELSSCRDRRERICNADVCEKRRSRVIDYANIQTV
jgi:hypothetical protein